MEFFYNSDKNTACNFQGVYPNFTLWSTIAMTFFVSIFLNLTEQSGKLGL